MNVSLTLLISLKEDIHILNNLVDDISKRQKVQDLKSWLFPSKSYDFITQIVNSESFGNVSYQNCLEIAFDRIYVIVRLIVLYINKINLGKAAFQTTVLSIPSRLTVGCCFKLLWMQIGKLMGETSQRAIRLPNHGMLSNVETQTDIISLSTCDSCSSAMMCMKNLLNFFEESKDRLKIKYKIFDITQFGCMLKVTASIEDSIKELYKKLQDKNQENVSLKLENENYTARLMDNDKKIAFLKEEVLILREKLKQENQKTLLLQQENDELSQENHILQSNINNFDSIEYSLNNSVSMMEQKNKLLKDQNDTLTKNLNTSMKLLRHYSSNLTKKISVLDTEHAIMKSIIEQCENSVDSLNVKYVKFARNLEKVDLKIKYRYDCMNTLIQDVLKYEGFCEKIKNVFIEKLEKYREKLEKPQEVFQLKGNPIEDLTKQIEENKDKIKNIENESIKLCHLLTRFKTIKMDR